MFNGEVRPAKQARIRLDCHECGELTRYRSDPESDGVLCSECGAVNEVERLTDTNTPGVDL